MKDKKHIDRIFQEKLKDFEATPKDAVWERIHSELHQDTNNRRVIPIWWKIAGIAAGLLIMITVGNAVFNGDASDADVSPQDVVNTNEVTNDTQEEDTKNNKQEKDALNTGLENQLMPQNQDQITTIDDPQNTDSKDLTSDKNSVKNPINTSDKLYKTQKEALVNTDQVPEQRKDAETSSTTGVSSVKNRGNTGIASQNSPQQTTNDSPQNRVSDAVADHIPQNLPEQPTNKEHTPETTNALPLHDAKKDAMALAEVTKTEDDKEKEDLNKTTDEAPLTIEDALVSSEDEDDINEKEKDVMDRWSVTPNVSPVYYNTLGDGSSIHSQFDNNSKSGQLNMAFGLNASYAISEKLYVRSGISKVNVGYNTNDVVIYQSLNAQLGIPPAGSAGTLRNIDLKEGAQGISVISGENIAFSQVPEVVAQSLKSSLDQEISFIEVPVELEYKISDKKLGISVIGGFSTMILNNNNVYASINNERTLLGEANNINSVSYSANFGVGLGIKVSKKIDLNFEPTFKYQINTFKNASGDFNPYIIGVNSGLKFKF